MFVFVQEVVIYYIVIYKGAGSTHLMWRYHTALSLSAWFSQWCFLLFHALSGDVCIRRLVRFLHNSSPLGNLLLAWYGKEEGTGEITHEHFKHSSDGLVKTLSDVVVCLHHVSPFCFSYSNSLALGCILCGNSPLFTRRWTSLWHFTWQFPCLWANLHLTPVPSKKKVLHKTLTSISRP